MSKPSQRPRLVAIALARFCFHQGRKIGDCTEDQAGEQGHRRRCPWCETEEQTTTKRNFDLMNQEQQLQVPLASVYCIHPKDFGVTAPRHDDAEIKNGPAAKER